MKNLDGELMHPVTTSLDTSRLHQASGATPAAPAAPEVVAMPPAPVEPMSMDDMAALKNDIVAALCTCFDPEIPVNIYELGLIYDIEIAPSSAVTIRMTLTSPMCPAAGSLPAEVQ